MRMIANPSSYGDLYSPGQIFVGRKVRFILEALARCGGFFPQAGLLFPHQDRLVEAAQ